MLWALVDCNNFYASCERLFRPDLMGRPIVVLSNNDGCIVARSNEAKALGIPMGEPEFKARDLLKRHNVAAFSSNYALYGDISARVMQTMESLVPTVEQYSIDEAFIPLSGSLESNADELARTLRERIRKWTGIVVSVGIGTTRTLAKIASDKAKKDSGVFRLDAGTAVTEQTLVTTSVVDVWGIGRRSADKLRLLGIHTAKDLRDAEGAIIRKILSVSGLHTVMELRGIPCIGQSDAPTPRQTLVSSRSFGKKVTEKEALAEALAMHAARAGERLRHEKLDAGGIAIHIRTARHGKGPFYSETVNVTLAFPTANTSEFIKATREGLEAIFRPGFFYAKAGIMLFDLASPNGRQGSLLELTPDTENASKHKDKALMLALDVANKKFGRGVLRFAAEGRPDAPWHMQNTRRSQRWTTVWTELPEVGVRI